MSHRIAKWQPSLTTTCSTRSSCLFQLLFHILSFDVSHGSGYCSNGRRILSFPLSFQVRNGHWIFPLTLSAPYNIHRTALPSHTRTRTRTAHSLNPSAIFEFPIVWFMNEIPSEKLKQKHYTAFNLKLIKVFVRPKTSLMVKRWPHYFVEINCFLNGHHCEVCKVPRFHHLHVANRIFTHI